MTAGAATGVGKALVTVVFPCLDEEGAIGACVDQASGALRRANLEGEVLVVDNGSTDRSASIAREAGARVVSESRRGYGSAHLRGIREARGKVLVMLDADGTYPAEMIPEMVTPILSGDVDLVLGNRFANSLPREAMPWLNRYLGNPILSGLTRLLFRLSVRDLHCGMRAVATDRVRELGLQTPGMEFATEMIVKAVDHGLRVAEKPIPYRPRVGESKLSRWRDGWRHLEYMLVFSPALVFFWPGLLMVTAGLAMQCWLLSGPEVLFGRAWNLHTNLAGLVASLGGATLLVLGIISANYARTLGMRFTQSATARWLARIGDGLWRAVGALLLLLGAATWVGVFLDWWLSSFGALAALPVLSLASTLVTLGGELTVAAFVVNLVRLRGAGS